MNLKQNFKIQLSFLWGYFLIWRKILQSLTWQMEFQNQEREGDGGSTIQCGILAPSSSWIGVLNFSNSVPPRNNLLNSRRLKAVVQLLRVQRVSAWGCEEGQWGREGSISYYRRLDNPIFSASNCGIWYLHALSFSARVLQKIMICLLPTFSSTGTWV